MFLLNVNKLSFSSGGQKSSLCIEQIEKNLLDHFQMVYLLGGEFYLHPNYGNKIHSRPCDFIVTLVITGINPVQPTCSNSVRFLKFSHAIQKTMFSSLNSFFKNSCVQKENALRQQFSNKQTCINYA